MPARHQFLQQAARRLLRPTIRRLPAWNIDVSSVIHTEIPEQLLRQAQRMVDRGWAHSVDALTEASLRRFLESHPEEFAEQFVHEDVAWGLHGGE